MSSRRSAQPIYVSLKDTLKQSLQRFKSGLGWLLWVGRRRSRVAGFVLPTTVLLLLVVGLTVATLLLRAGVRTNQVIGQNQQRVIYNAATPAIDRARAKLETLFSPDGDPRYPGGVPSENYLAGMLRNDNSYGVPPADDPDKDRYTLPDETRVNLDDERKTGEETPEDNAWVFRTDSNGDGELDATVVYSILLKTPDRPADLLTASDQTKSGQLWVRRGPLSNEQRASCSVKGSPEGGWFQDNGGTALLRKPFQVNALVIPDTANQNGNFTTLEFQQDRQLDRGNKWGAWFRNDLETSPGAIFNWNGAMHSEGSLVVTSSQGFNAYLVSAPESCLMSNASNSEISVTSIAAPTTPTDPPQFTGLTAVGSIRDNAYGPGGGVNIHVWPATNAGPSRNEPLTAGNDSANQTNPISQIALDPEKLLTEDVSQSRVVGGASNASNFQPNTGTTFQFPDGAEYPRITNKQQPKPFVDDLYRADNRWGPKPRYSDKIVLSGAGQAYGNLITTGNVSQAEHFDQMTKTPDDGADQIGLDGYWERRARAEGLRVIVGQRLELGNSSGWSNTDPLYPPDTLPTTRVHESLQRRALRDNLAAVQSTAIYHTANPNGKDLPVACLASTAHPGTAQTLRDSLTFNTTGTPPTLITDFLNGKGTNGWEFEWPYDTEQAFAAAIAEDTPLGNALRNLAQFAGDHVDDTQTGAFPPTQAAAGGVVHPYPLSTMWGNFSELRRILLDPSRLNGGVTYQALSPAEKTTLHTATCTLGMLAYNLQNVYAQGSGLLFEQVERDRTNGFEGTNPKYPALFYLFPKDNHDHDGGEGSVPAQPTTEPYIDPRATYDPTNYINTLNGGISYQVLNPSDPDDFAGVAIQPRSATFTGTDGSGDWVSPYAITPSNIQGANVSTNRITAPDGSPVAVGFLDRVIMNGREMMPARVMDLDIGMLRSRGITNNQPWLPVSGVVYAFREDAVREDGIARPAGTGMDLATLPGTDPALVETSKNISVSTKQVDYLPDPDRRIHGFRLRNGAQVKRNDSFGIQASDNNRGITFVSDNPTYIQGNFNLHQTGGDDTAGTRLEEFTQTLPDDAVYNNAQFYGRTRIDTNFAQASDRWRPSEILSDAVTLLSNNFCDGSLKDVFLNPVLTDREIYAQVSGCVNTPDITVNTPDITSFQNFNRPLDLTTVWLREDGSLPNDPNVPNPSPIKIDRNGRPLTGPSTAYAGGYQDFSFNKRATQMNRAAQTRVNAVIVSGIVPSRVNQVYGGLENFPRFLENWLGVNMQFAGSFLQLNFSNYGTGQFDQDSWEPGSTPTTARNFFYYDAPNRIWGYDPGLQLAPASPALARFITLNRQRTESYNELPMNDPYIQRLCQAAKTSGITQVANLNCPA